MQPCAPTRVRTNKRTHKHRRKKRRTLHVPWRGLTHHPFLRLTWGGLVSPSAHVDVRPKNRYLQWNPGKWKRPYPGSFIFDPCQSKRSHSRASAPCQGARYQRIISAGGAEPPQMRRRSQILGFKRSRPAHHAAHASRIRPEATGHRGSSGRNLRRAAKSDSLLVVSCGKPIRWLATSCSVLTSLGNMHQSFGIGRPWNLWPSMGHSSRLVAGSALAGPARLWARRWKPGGKTTPAHAESSRNSV